MTSEAEATAEEHTADDAAGMLRAARLAKGVELEHISAETRIPLRHLKTIEAGEYDSLPSRTYALGFARSYAREVDLDQELIADLVRAEMANNYSERSAFGDGMDTADPAKTPSSGLAWFGGFAALLLLAGAGTFAYTYYGSGSGPASLLAGSDEANEVADDADATADGADATGNAAVDPSGKVILTAEDDEVWVRVTVANGDRLLDGTLSKGETFEVPSSAEEPRINTGRPDALGITIGGESVPKLADEPISLGDELISAEALLARADLPNGSDSAVN